MGKPYPAISAELQAAQRRLLQLRAQLQVNRLPENSQQESLFSFKLEKGKERPLPTHTAVTQLPSHLGWESHSATQLLRQTLETVQANGPLLQIPQTSTVPTPITAKTVKVYPDIAIGLLKSEQVAAGRLWLLLQVVDTQSCGWVEEKSARHKFTGKRSGHRFCGGRQLRNLLVQGEEIFWVRENGRIWLRSVAKVAFALGITRLQMRPVALPVSILRQKIGTVRAHLYATFHSSRTPTKEAKKPIARTTVAQLTEVQPRTQRRYERKARVKRQAQFAIGPQATTENLQARGWAQGQATFQFKDFKGKQGQPGKQYVAWQLPNSYVGPHAQQPKGRQKRINRALTDLFMQGITGNDQCSQVGGKPSPARRFFDNGRLAAKSYSRNPETDHYWQGTDNGRYQLWQVMESKKIQ